MSATGSVLLDTSIIIDYLRKRDWELVRQLESAGELFLPLVALGELLFGAHKSKQKERTLDDVANFVQVCTIVEPDEVTADLYGQIKASLDSRRTPIPQNDIWIAASALEHDLPLATRDQHFSKVAGLAVLDW